MSKKQTLLKNELNEVVSCPCSARVGVNPLEGEVKDVRGN